MRLRNVAIIAHVDHGKPRSSTSCSVSRDVPDNQRVAERAMDSNDLEKERGITILAKCTSVDWHGTRINIVDTPGHADSAARSSDPVDGRWRHPAGRRRRRPMPQTKFVTAKRWRSG